MSANQLKSDTVKFCFHCGYLNDSKRDVCLYCGYELPNVIHTKNEQKQLEKTFNNYVLNDLGMNKFLSDFNSHLKNLNFKRKDERLHIMHILLREYVNQRLTLMNLENRFYELIPDFRRIEQIPDCQFQELILNEALNMFKNLVLNEAEIGFLLREHIPAQRVAQNVVKNKHGTGTKIVATGMFGIFGLAGTSGVKEETVYKTIPARIEIKLKIFLTIKNSEIILRYEKPNPNDKPVPTEIIKWNQIIGLDDQYFLKLIDGRNILLKNLNNVISLTAIDVYCVGLNHSDKKGDVHPLFSKIDRQEIYEEIMNLLKIIINTKATGKENIQDINQKSIAEEIEKFHDLKEKGIISEEEFESKKNILLKSSGMTINPQELESKSVDKILEQYIKPKNIESKINNEFKFCTYCGTKLSLNDNFCPECGKPSE